MSDETNVNENEETRENAHEPNTFNVRVAVYAVVGLVFLSAIGFGVTFMIYRALGKPVEQADQLPPEFVRTRPQPPKPTWHRRTQDLEETRREADQRLHSYGWIDKDAGIARVPISRAMEIIAREGLGPESGKPSEKPAPEPPKPTEKGNEIP